MRPMRSIVTLAVALVLCRHALGADQPSASLPSADPATAGMDPDRLRHIDRAVEEELAKGRLPGCVVLVARNGMVVFRKAFGHKRLVPERQPMTTDTVFDLASLTKPIATASSILLLAERGKLRLADRVAQHLPEFAANGKDQITIEQLLLHQGGLIADNNLADYADGPEKSIERLLALKPTSRPGTRFVYSDVGFLVLGEVVRRVAGQDLHQFTRENVFSPLGLRETGFLPAEELRRRAAPTERRDDRWLEGEVHDPRAAKLGGVAGHAGLFSTADELAVYAQMLLGDGKFGPARVLSPASVERMTRRHAVAGGFRGLGWDMQTGYSSNRGELMSEQAFGHGGFTGTSLWIDPRWQLTVIFLSNRLHPDGKGSVNPLAGRIGSIAVGAIRAARPRQTPDEGQVLTGIDVLARGGFAELRGRRVGLVANHTAVDRQGKSTSQLLAAAPEVKLVALFSPEHGPQGNRDEPRIADTRDADLNVPVYSLYGTTRRPTAEQLRDVDTLVFDIQDIGARFYTYPATLVECLRAAAEHKLKVVVLDRPNPLGGVAVAGPLADAERLSFTAFGRVPVRHGMTVGELARLLKDELALEVDLQVVPLEGWRREMYYDATGLTWINPSPNMRSLTAAVLYPGIGLLETTNVSVGRGTDRPFELVGAPWLDGRRLASALAERKLSGVSFVPLRFRPTASVLANQDCGGINLIVTDRQAFEPVRLGIEIAVALRALYANEWKAEQFGRLLANQAALDALLNGQSGEEIEKIWRNDLERFRERRLEFLLYR
jgi:uncharacterized protein YbbC (DUF1343 family)